MIVFLHKKSKNMEDIKIVLNEGAFTSVCKNGSIDFGRGYDKSVLNISRLDMIKVALGEEISVKVFDKPLFKISLEGVQNETIKEIIKRSPIYSDIYYELELKLREVK